MMNESTIKAIRDALQKSIDDAENKCFILTRDQLKDIVEALEASLNLIPAKVPNWK